MLNVSGEFGLLKLSRAARPGYAAGVFAEAPIDFSRRFMPEQLTPLFHTPGYARLAPEPRLRYNQLQACYFNEQTIFFESAMARQILGDLLSRNLPPGLADGLRQFIAEEAEHSKIFRELNRRCLPKHYANGDFHFDWTLNSKSNKRK